MDGSSVDGPFNKVMDEHNGRLLELMDRWVDERVENVWLGGMDECFIKLMDRWMIIKLIHLMDGLMTIKILWMDECFFKLIDGWFDVGFD